MAISIKQHTIPEILVQLGTSTSVKSGLTFVEDSRDQEKFVRYQDLSQHVSLFAGALAESGLNRGERLLLVLPDNYQFSVAFLAALHGGFVAIPTTPPLTATVAPIFAEHVKKIASVGTPSMLVTSPELKPILARALRGTIHSVLTFAELQNQQIQFPFQAPQAHDLAFLQFTSGSTANPKGVAVEFRNLSANIQCISEDVFDTCAESDVFISWLPLHHDMGLIAMLLTAIASQCSAVLLPSTLFLKRPAEWFRAISKYRGTITFAPNFAYGLCTKRVKDQELEGVDLSSLRIAGCAAEPINAQTLRDFSNRFAPFGFNQQAIFPCYGLAENTVAVSSVARNSGLKIDTVDRQLIASSDRAAPVATTNANAVEIVSCGRGFREHQIAIFNEMGSSLPDRQIGEISLRGQSVMRGYFNNPNATAKALRYDWLHTGDMGYLVDGELFVCGRKKEMIILAGRNYYPTDIEWSASEVSGIRKGNVVAFGIVDITTGTEQVVICAETHQPKKLHPEMIALVKAKVLEHLGIRLHQVVLLTPSSLPKTSSGKLQRGKAKQIFLDGKLRSKSKHWKKIMLLKHLVADWRGQIAGLFLRPWAHRANPIPPRR